MGDAGQEALGPRPVYSALAAASLLLAVVSMLGCLGAIALGLAVKPSLAGVILVLPALGLAAAVCGGLALRRIRRSDGRLMGRGAALLGLFVGLMSAVLQGAAGYGAMAAFWPIKREVVPVVARLVGAGLVGPVNVGVARVALAPATDSALDDARLEWFIGALRARAGSGIVPWFELQTLVDARAALAGAPGGAGSGGPDVPQEWPKPISLRGDSGRVVLFVFIDDEELKKDRVLVRDALVFQDDHRAMTLLPDGPAARVARWVGAPIESPAAAPASP